MTKMTAGAYANRIGGSPSEKKSWESNAAKIVSLLELAKVPDDVHVAFEYKSPLAGRVDCMLFAHGKDGSRHIVHIELKQWSNDTVSQMYGTGVFKVEALVGGDYRILSHPSQQALGYQQNIENYIDVVTAEGTTIEGHAYCYNYYYDGRPSASARRVRGEARRDGGQTLREIGVSVFRTHFGWLQGAHLSTLKDFPVHSCGG